MVPSSPSPAPAAELEPPKPPAKTDSSGRFIALDMAMDRVTPAAPTSAPATIRAMLLMARPDMATAVPVQAFNTEMTDPAYQRRRSG